MRACVWVRTGKCVCVSVCVLLFPQNIYSKFTKVKITWFIYSVCWPRAHTSAVLLLEIFICSIKYCLQQKHSLCLSVSAQFAISVRNGPNFFSIFDPIHVVVIYLMNSFLWLDHHISRDRHFAVNFSVLGPWIYHPKENKRNKNPIWHALALDMNTHHRAKWIWQSEKIATKKRREKNREIPLCGICVCILCCVVGVFVCSCVSGWIVHTRSKP